MNPPEKDTPKVMEVENSGDYLRRAFLNCLDLTNIEVKSRAEGERIAAEMGGVYLEHLTRPGGHVSLSHFAFESAEHDPNWHVGRYTNDPGFYKFQCRLVGAPA